MSTAEQEMPDYLNPDIPSNLKRLMVPVVEATAESMKGYGLMVDDPKDYAIEITRWPAQGWRPVDLDCGDEGGTVEGVFDSQWKGNILYGKNDAVGGHYVLGWSDEPDKADEQCIDALNDKVLLWHANYHPDGGQLFWPIDGQPFVVPVALPGDDVKAEDFIALRSDGTKGIYIHPYIWHEGAFPIGPGGKFFDKQGAVHARVTCNIAKEFGVLLQVPLV
jgi:ureidoglycolate lyase